MSIAIPKKRRSWKIEWQRNWQLYFLAIPIIAFFAVFHYAPMFGLTMAFQDYNPAKGFFGSQWVGWKNFADFFGNPDFPKILRNTLAISFLGLIFGFPINIIFALSLNDVTWKPFKKTIQTISYMPYFVSVVIMCGLVIDFVSSSGIITNLLVNVFGMERTNLLSESKYFWWIYLASEIWAGTGYGSIVFLAAMTNVSPELHEAAAIDGANRLQRVWHVTLPALLPTVVTMLILRCGTIMSVGFEKVLLLYNPSIYDTADVISTHVQRMGINRQQYGYSTAVGLFNSVVSTALLLTSNYMSKRYMGSSVI